MQIQNVTRDTTEISAFKYTATQGPSRSYWERNCSIIEILITSFILIYLIFVLFCQINSNNFTREHYYTYKYITSSR